MWATVQDALRYENMFYARDLLKLALKMQNPTPILAGVLAWIWTAEQVNLAN